LKIAFYFQNNNSVNPQNKKISFGAGLTPQIMKEIQKVDVAEISKKLAQKGIPTDFRGNKIIAWCCDKTIEIFEKLNKKYKTSLSLPKGIFVENFEELNLDSQNKYGFCNLLPTKLRRNSGEIVPSRVVFFNSFETARNQAKSGVNWTNDWNHIDIIADFLYVNKQSGTDFFLYPFMHELTHASHENRLLNRIGGKALAREIYKVKDEQQIAKYQKKYDQKISQICNSALTDPFEAIACDLPRVIESCLDKTTLMPIHNPFINSPYEKLYFWQPKRIKIPIYTDKDRPLKEILRNFWNGKFD